MRLGTQIPRRTLPNKSQITEWKSQCQWFSTWQESWSKKSSGNGSQSTARTWQISWMSLCGVCPIRRAPDEWLRIQSEFHAAMGPDSLRQENQHSGIWRNDCPWFSESARILSCDSQHRHRTIHSENSQSRGNQRLVVIPAGIAFTVLVLLYYLSRKR